jgi:dihydroxyacetone kinase-like predicted kinase
MKTVAEEGTDITFIQEPHNIQGKVIGISTKYKTFTAGEDRGRAAVVVTNNQIDTMLIHQLSDADSVVIEILKGKTKIIAASMYFDREKQIEHDMTKIEAILQHAKNTKVVIASDCNASSTLWHNKLTNNRGRILEEFITSKQLYILNEESSNTTFRNRLCTNKQHRPDNNQPPATEQYTRMEN